MFLHSCAIVPRPEQSLRRAPGDVVELVFGQSHALKKSLFRRTVPVRLLIQ